MKCELVDLIASIDFKVVTYIEGLLPGDQILLNQKTNQLAETNNLTENLEEDDSSLTDSELKFKCGHRRFKGSSQFLLRNTQERIIDDVFLYLLGSEDNKLRLETAKSLTRFVANMNFFEGSSTTGQNVLLATSESLLKTGGFAANLFNSSMVENDSCNLSSLSFLFNSNSENGGTGNVGGARNRSNSYSSTTSILYSQKQVTETNFSSLFC